MHINSYLTVATLSIASLLGGCAVSATDIDNAEGDVAVDEVEDTGEAQDALVGCYGESCNGQDPGAMGCDDDATTVASSTFGPSGTVAIRRSQACNAVWTRVSTTSPSYLRAEIVRNQGMSDASGASSQSIAPVYSQRSLMLGFKPGNSYRGNGWYGPAFNVYPYMGNVFKQY